MTRALYPGSFNPFHVGHADVLIQALQIYDEVIICQLMNPEKSEPVRLNQDDVIKAYEQVMADRVKFDEFTLPEFPQSRVLYSVVQNELMVTVAKELKCHSVIRGLRNSHDLQYEMDLLAWNKQLGLKIPCPMFLAAPRYAHISSSSLRSLAKIKH